MFVGVFVPVPPHLAVMSIKRSICAQIYVSRYHSSWPMRICHEADRIDSSSLETVLEPITEGPTPDLHNIRRLGLTSI